MEDLRRQRLGEMFLDVTKYIVTIIVIGGLVSNQIQSRSVLLGVVLAIAIGATGYWLIPPTKEREERPA